MFGLENLGLWGLFIGTFLAATVLPFSSDVLYLAILAATKDPAGCLLVGTLGNWLGSVLTYWIGWAGRWEWIEKWLKVKPEIGDIVAIALGFYKTRPVWTMVLLLIGKFARFLVWNMIYGLF